MHKHTEFLKIINTGIEKLDFGKTPDKLYEPVYYSISVGGKRIRPVLCLMANELFGGNYLDALNAAYGIEIFHNFTLLHDDMMDKALMRRGKPTVHAKWNENIALLSGDAMSVIAYKYISETKHLKKILNVFSDTALKICEGQQYDMDFETDAKVKVEDYLMMINLKTAVLLAASLKIGAITADANEIDCENIYKFGQNLGMAFQLQDDFLDSFGDEKVFGKSIGGDIIANKKTFLLIKAMELADEQTKNELCKWVSLNEFNHEEKICAVLNIYNKLGIKELSISLMEEYFDKACHYFSTINISNEKKENILNFTNSLKFRKY